MMPPTRRCNRAGVELIKKWEGLRLEAYRCPAGVWTIGYGHTGDVSPGDKITRHQAEAILSLDLDIYERGVDEALGSVETGSNEFSALVSFAFNLGVKAFSESTMLKKLRAGKPRDEVAAELMKWVNAAGRVQPGLVRRRAAERALFLSPDGVA